MLTLAGTSWSFDRASVHLKELCHLSVSDDTIERVCQEEGERARQWMAKAAEPVKAFGKACGEAEFSTDGTMINTTQGWREMRLSTLAKREPALACEPGEWNHRVLNEPTVRLSSCAIADALHVGASWKRLSKRMKLQAESVLHLVADGAKWIWEQAGLRLPKHDGQWCLDIYHLSEHLHQCGRSLHAQPAAARAWGNEHLEWVLSSHGPALIARIESEQATEKGSARCKAMENLLGYLRPNRDRMWYRERLQAGVPIGSGMIEGGCKNILAARLKLNSARWRVKRAERIGALRCVDASKLWQAFWLPQAA